MKTYSHAVYIGRFQPVHKGHLDGLRVALQNAEKVIIVIGSVDRPRSPRHPFTAKERQYMLEAAIIEEFPLGTLDRICFTGVRDRYNYNLWTQDVQKAVVEKISSCLPSKICIVGHKKGDTEYLNAFPQWDLIEVKQTTDINATQIREALYNKDLDSFIKVRDTITNMVPDGAALYLTWWIQTNTKFEYLCKEHEFYQKDKESWAGTPYPVIFNTVDSVVVRSGHVLMIRRKFHPGKGLLALPGGYLNPREFSLDGAIREQQKEEAKMDLTPLGIKRPSDLKRFMVGRDFYEHPDRSERGRVITFAYMFDLGDGPLPKLKAGDDAGDAFWVPLANIDGLYNEIFDDHASIIEDMTNRFGKKF